MYVVELDLKPFSAAHRILKGYQGKCKHLHGHNYYLRVKLGAKQLNQYDFVVDFSVIKKHFNGWVQEELDHGLLIAEFDEELKTFAVEHKQDHFILTGNKNTSVEALAEYVFNHFLTLMHEHREEFGEVELLSLQMWETREASAIVTKDGLTLTGAVCG